MNKVISKNLPADIQPYERCRKDGPAALNNAELLAVILRTGTVGENSLSLASRLLEYGCLSELVSMTVPQLTAVKGIGTVKAIQLQCVGELAKRLSVSGMEESIFNSPETIASYYMGRLAGEVQEHVILMLLDSRGRLIKDMVLTKGTVNQSLLSPREIFVEAFRYQAVRIVLIHNHPSGDPTPSQDDIASTKRVSMAGELAAIPLLDHIIVGNHSYISLKERGYIS